MFYPAYPVASLRPAPYNPRKITGEAFLELRRSIALLGMIKPIIVGPDNTIVAGHQRLKALTANGGETTPIFQLKSISRTDEVRFNQLHNGTDLDTGDEGVRVPACGGLGYYDVPADGVSGNGQAEGANIRSEIAQLLIKHGPWGGIVASQRGECLSGAQYALACTVLGMPVRTYYVSDDQAQLVRALFRQAYGQFSYEHLKRETYIQTFAQPGRINPFRERDRVHPSWTQYVLPEWKPGEHILDFGCGHGEFLKILAAERPDVPVWGMEFFRRVQGTDYLDTAATHKMCDQLFEHLRTHGRFDLILCDWVLNSVDSQEAENAVLATCAALLKPGGRIWFSGRQREWPDALKRSKTFTSARRGVEFLDENGLTALLNRGHWFYQKFHTRPQVEELMRQYFGPEIYYTATADRYRIRVVKAHELPPEVTEAALRFEFELPWPGDRTVGRGEQAVQAWRTAVRDGR